MKFKGMSPLIAAIMLIAITMSISIFISYWATNLTEETTSELDNFREDLISSECNFVNFNINSCFYSNAEEEMKFIIDNIGSNNIKNITVFIIYPDSSIDIKVPNNNDVVSGNLKSFTIDNVNSGFTNLRIRTHCPRIFEETTCR